MPNSLKLLPCLGLLGVVPIAVAAGLMATGPATAEASEELKDAVTDTGASGDSAGDILTFANDVFDADEAVVTAVHQPRRALASLGRQDNRRHLRELRLFSKNQSLPAHFRAKLCSDGLILEVDAFRNLIAHCVEAKEL
jgi:hypothetical protein